MASILQGLSCKSVFIERGTKLIIRVDEGAYRAITNKESGGRLLPAGVLRVEGVFASHQGVRLVVKRRRKDTKHQKTLTDASLDHRPWYRHPSNTYNPPQSHPLYHPFHLPRPTRNQIPPISTQRHQCLPL
jgi:hypothetical protein